MSVYTITRTQINDIVVLKEILKELGLNNVEIGEKLIIKDWYGTPTEVDIAVRNIRGRHGKLYEFGFKKIGDSYSMVFDKEYGQLGREVLQRYTLKKMERLVKKNKLKIKSKENLVDGRIKLTVGR